MKLGIWMGVILLSLRQTGHHVQQPKTMPAVPIRDGQPHRRHRPQLLEGSGARYRGVMRSWMGLAGVLIASSSLSGYAHFASRYRSDSGQWLLGCFNPRS